MFGFEDFICNSCHDSTKYLNKLVYEEWRLDIVLKSLQVVGSKYANTCILQDVSILLVNNIYIGNSRKVWHRKLHVNTYIVQNFSNVSIPQYCILIF